MRREDKEIRDRTEIESIIERATVCRVAFSENDVPYIVPVNFGYRDDRLYFHSAPEGKKIEILKHNNQVCFEIDIDHEVLESGSPCDWGMRYRSVIGFGTAFFVEDPEEKRRALDIIVQHYSGKSSEYPQSAIDDVAIVKVEIQSMTGKKSGY
jgi:nitroimidazol reductase NimA-like FMN-containing flavoprotein (pyridoxamine 5'-phosphate oxidase superfamily)